MSEARSERMATVRADVHLHHIPAAFLEYLRTEPVSTDAVFTAGDKGELLTIGGRWPFPLNPAFYDLARLESDMAAAGVTVAALSPVPQLFRYWDPSIDSIALAQRLNNELLAVARSRPGKFWVLAHVPLQHVTAAAAELERVVAAGASGAIVGTDVEGVALSDARFEPFWQMANKLGCCLFLHPLLPSGPRFSAHYLSSFVGNPFETALAAGELVLSGVLERYRNVRLLLAHGGGYLPYQFARMEKGWHIRPEAREAITKPPSEYLNQIWFDTVIFDAATLQYLLQFAGPKRVALGSDYPFAIATWPHDVAVNTLPSETLAQVGNSSAYALLGDVVT